MSIDPITLHRITQRRLQEQRHGAELRRLARPDRPARVRGWRRRGARPVAPDVPAPPRPARPTVADEAIVGATDGELASSSRVR